MSSQINPSSINVNFPVPGVSQPSQGFRNLALATQNNFAEAVAELNDLFNKVIVSAPLLYGGNTSINNFGGMQNSNLSLFDFAYTSANITATTANSVPTLNFTNTSVANINITAGSPTIQTINIANFPNLGYSEFRLQVEATTPPQYLNLSALVPGASLSTSGNIGIAGFNSSTGNFTITSTTPLLITLGSLDGLNWLISSPTTASAKSYTPLTSVGAPGDTTGMVAFDSNYIYVCVANYNGSTHIWERATLGTF